MDVRLAHTGRGDLDKFGSGAHLFNGGAAAVAHACAKSPDHLVKNGKYAALVWHPAFYALGNQFIGVIGRVLEIAVGGAVLHGADGAHAAIEL